MCINPVEVDDKEEIKENVRQKLDLLEQRGERVDYLTFIADGEPTLASNLAEIIKSVRDFNINTAIITNSSTIDRPGVKESLKMVDWVSLKCDAYTEEVWHKINRPHGGLEPGKIKNGMIEFSRDYSGKMVTETMLVKGINDSEEELKSIASFFK